MVTFTKEDLKGKLHFCPVKPVEQIFSTLYQFGMSKWLQGSARSPGQQYQWVYNGFTSKREIEDNKARFLCFNAFKHVYLTIFRMGIFRATDEWWGGGEAKRNFAQLYLS